MKESFYIYETQFESKGENGMTVEIKAEKACRVWQEIGREVGEFKHKDILMTDDGPIIVMRPSSVVPYRGGMIALDELYAQGKIEGIYPAESFISIEAGDYGSVGRQALDENDKSDAKCSCKY